ncbi:MAG TPA: SIR2 family protein, partial [Myxococcales bacterium]|nr:SIR2 family protein [Myxococcales bacterium]
AEHARDHASRIWIDTLRQRFDQRIGPQHQGTALARAVWSIASNLVITTNFDRLLASVAPEGVDTIDSEANVNVIELTQVFPPPKPTLWHLHGKLDRIHDLILTVDGFEKLWPGPGAKARYEAAKIVLTSLMLRFSFIFVGCSMEDVLVSHLHELATLFSGSTPTHYVITRTEEEAARIRREVPKGIVHVLSTEERGYGNDVRELLQDLDQKAQPKAQTLVLERVGQSLDITVSTDVTGLTKYRRSYSGWRGLDNAELRVPILFDFAMNEDQIGTPSRIRRLEVTGQGGARFEPEFKEDEHVDRYFGHVVCPGPGAVSFETLTEIQGAFLPWTRGSKQWIAWTSPEAFVERASLNVVWLNGSAPPIIRLVGRLTSGDAETEIPVARSPDGATWTVEAAMFRPGTTLSIEWERARALPASG